MVVLTAQGLERKETIVTEARTSLVRGASSCAEKPQEHYLGERFKGCTAIYLMYLGEEVCFG